MHCGVSTACFYPEETASAMRRLCGAGVATVELFLNSFSELTPEYTARLRALQQDGARICALHPFTSMMETFLFATEYPTRLADGIRFYEQYFSMCQALCIPRVVFHGMLRTSTFPFERHCENYLALRRRAREFGVDLLQENVVRCRCGYPEAVRQMRRLTGDDVGFVLDTKQLRRAGVPLPEMLDAMGGRLRHVHLSDFTSCCDCTAPGTGREEFHFLARHLRAIGYDGCVIIELYRSGFRDLPELMDGLRFTYEIFGGETASRTE